MNTRAKLVQFVVLLTIGVMALLNGLEHPSIQLLRGGEIGLLVTAGLSFGAALMTLIAKDPRAVWRSGSSS